MQSRLGQKKRFQMSLDVLKFAWNCAVILEEGKREILCGI
jgi:hypothetical protein